MESNKQTAVEWLIEQMPLGIRMNLAENGIDFNQAKEMEKEQIMDAYGEGFSNGNKINFRNRNEYYNDTYEK